MQSHILNSKPRSVVAGFSRHGIPPPATNDTGIILAKDGSDWSRDLATLNFDLGGHGTCGWCGSSSSIRIPSLKLVGLAVRKIWRTMRVSINWPGDLVLWPFDLESGTRVALKVGNIHSKFGHPRLTGYPVIRYQILLAWDHPIRRYCILKMLRRWTVSALRVLETPSTSVSHRNQTDGVRLLKFSA